VVVCARDDSLPPISAAIEKLGVKNVTHCKDLPSMLALLEQGVVDVLIGDYVLLGADFLDAAQKIRQKQHGRNPFLILIATAELPSADTLRALIDSGIDDLLRSPVSPERLMAGLNGFSQKRRPFVASYDYVGPTRRAPTRDGKDSSSLIEVPNTLKSKVQLDLSDQEVQRVLELAQVELEGRQGETRAIEMHDLAAQICKQVRENPRAPENQVLLEKLIRLTEDFAKRNQDLLAPQIIRFAGLLGLLARRIMKQTDSDNDADLQLLENLTQAIRRALTVERDSVALMVDILETVARHRSIH
jgi:CheY-like chemotaxis protein